MEFFVELLLEVFGELLLELAIACLGEYASHRSKRPALAAVGSVVFGVLIAIFSLWPLPSHLIYSPTLRLVSLIASPLAVGFLLGARGWLSQRPFRWVSFWGGFLLAASIGLVRYFFAT